MVSIISSHSDKLTDDVSFGSQCLQACSGASSRCLIRSVCGEFLRLVDVWTNGFRAGLYTASGPLPVSYLNVWPDRCCYIPYVNFPGIYFTNYLTGYCEDTTVMQIKL